MTAKLDILMVSPDAPPKNSPESMQVHRILAELDRRVTGVLVTTPAQGGAGWARSDPSLRLDLSNIDVMTLRLPAHRLLSRIIGSQRMARFHVPDAEAWLPLMAGQTVRRLNRSPDVIYSRSCPLSSALLGKVLKTQLGIPWIMHLSDPWVENFYRRSLRGRAAKRDAELESDCFASADLISMTTEGQAEFYRRKYPEKASNIFVTPNVMPSDWKFIKNQKSSTYSQPNKSIIIVYTGAFYGRRSPDTLLAAIDKIRQHSPELLISLCIDVYGNAQDTSLRKLRDAPSVLHYHGPVGFAEAREAQMSADILLTIEPDGESPLLKHILLAKTVDYLSARKPILAITPEDSETWRLCREGYGWAVRPSDADELASLLIRLIHDFRSGRPPLQKKPPRRYCPEYAVSQLVDRMEKLVGRLNRT